ncbi:MCE family protein [Nocardioides sp. NPDC057767]|jgi:phospholipid/cholesterol/gamma-HCH transport system substrate-binding protein|uniref:Phospholipid/cholesterol/gamma-HCH transport system substrate-binding protein n=1 Tax=Nocardioides albertanoniae TaxID=1175486 RepID=A0A543ACU1_9ACTN|nr:MULTISPECIES: MCE family protein [Nocardioides]EGD41028.1 virulence factor Mce family protein [Nocardioidaceae bacterium Broad-1]MBC7277378.1 MCE family protein [Nocardioides sp.]TQL70398.1 phospholipid/cholesterol/gamma-HCH transport system substrate-binding protein [Nocardioides albertanoniae]
MTNSSSLLLRRVLIGLALLLLATGGYYTVKDTRSTVLTAVFSNADGLYEGDDVKVLGVAVGRVTEVDPQDDGVHVRIEVEGGQRIPAEANAAIVSPSLVSGRFVQLSPAYTDGPAMPDGGQIQLDRTAVPVSFDEVKKQLTDLATALAPDGSGKQPLRTAIETLDANLRNGNAEQLSEAVEGLRSATATLSDGRADMFTTVSNLNSFTKNLAVNDAAVAGFTEQLSEVSAVLAANRRELTKAIEELSAALVATGELTHDNRGRIKNSVRDLNLLSAALADRSNQLAAILHMAPTALIDLFNVIDKQAITGRASLTGLNDAAQLVCGAVLGAGGTAQQCRDALAPLVDLIKTAQQGTTGPGATGPGTGQPEMDPPADPGRPPTPLPDLGSGLDGVQPLLPGLLGTDLGGDR